MTRIDFYVLPDSDPQSRLLLICKLAEKAVQRSQRVFIHADKPDLLSQLDINLWNFRSDSFVAHRLLVETELPDQTDCDPVQLSLGEPAVDRRVLINLAEKVPAFFSRFERTLEVVNQAQPVRESGRLRYRFYRERGYPLQHHKM